MLEFHPKIKPPKKLFELSERKSHPANIFFNLEIIVSPLPIDSCIKIISIKNCFINFLEPFFSQAPHTPYVY